MNAIEMEMTIIFIVAIVGAFLIFLTKSKKASWIEPKEKFPEKWRHDIAEKVPFYAALNDEEKNHFEFKIQEFLANTRVTGIGVAIDHTDKLLVAASAIIPIFQFPNWKYYNLFEVLVYEGTFNEKFETTGADRNITGMVGTGYMNGKMILSKSALHLGFDNESDKKNVAIHEFVHLIDKRDGIVDGIPKVLMEKQYVIPWLDLINKKTLDIVNRESDINPYGTTNQAEFLAVTSEYFFERPKLLENKHPQLYEVLEKMFRHDMADRKLNRKNLEIGRNDPCPCGSGKKFKKCCGSLK